MEDDVQLMQRFLQQSNEYFLDSEDYVRLDTYYLLYDVALVLRPGNSVVRAAVDDCNYQTVFLESDDYSLMEDYDLLLYYVVVGDGDDD